MSIADRSGNARDHARARLIARRGHGRDGTNAPAVHRPRDRLQRRRAPDLGSRSLGWELGLDPLERLRLASLAQLGRHLRDLLVELGESLLLPPIRKLAETLRSSLATVRSANPSSSRRSSYNTRAKSSPLA